MTDAAYVPIMFRQGWVLERYYGWTVIREGPSLKLLKKKHGPFAKLLMLARDASEEEIAETALRHGLLKPLSFGMLNDFSSQSEEESRIIAGARFRRVTSGRWFGIGTFVLDLSADLETLCAQMQPKKRNECRKAQKLGVKVELATRPRDEEINAFLGLYGRMARERGLESPRREILQQMFAGGDLLMCRCLDSRGQSLVFNLIYLLGDQGYYLYSARANGIPGGAGVYAHWEIIKKLKAAGFRWYDLGLVASSDSADGIYWFKRSFGGTFVDFGREYHHIPRGLATAYRTFGNLRGRLRKLL